VRLLRIASAPEEWDGSSSSSQEAVWVGDDSTKPSKVDFSLAHSVVSGVWEGTQSLQGMAKSKDIGLSPDFP